MSDSCVVYVNEVLYYYFSFIFHLFFTFFIIYLFYSFKVGTFDIASTQQISIQFERFIHIQWNPALPTPALYGHRLIRTTDTFLCPESQTLIYCQPRFTDTGYLHTVYFHCHNYVIIVDVVPCSNHDRFLRVNKILLQY